MKLISHARALWRALTARLVPHWRALWRAWSIRLNGIGLLILGWFAIDPVGVLAVWNMMPAAVHQIIPAQVVSILGAILFALSMIARLVRQPKLKEKIDAEEK